MSKELLSGVNISNKKFDVLVIAIGVILLVILFLNSIAIWPYIIEMSKNEDFQYIGSRLIKIGSITTVSAILIGIITELLVDGKLSYRVLFGILYLISSLSFLITMMALKLNILILQSDSFVSNFVAWLVNMHFAIFMALLPTLIAMLIALLLRVALLAIQNAKGA